MSTDFDEVFEVFRLVRTAINFGDFIILAKLQTIVNEYAKENNLQKIKPSDLPYTPRQSTRNEANNFFV
jgi:hypothetical protein